MQSSPRMIRMMEVLPYLKIFHVDIWFKDTEEYEQNIAKFIRNRFRFKSEYELYLAGTLKIKTKLGKTKKLSINQQILDFLEKLGDHCQG